MADVIKEYAGVVTVTLHPELSMLKLSWTSFFNAKDVFKPVLELQLELVKKHGLRHVVVDSSVTTGVLPDDAQKWIVEDFFPRQGKTTLKKLITIVPKSAVTQLANKRWQSVGNAFGFEILNAASLEDAEQLCRS